MKDLKPDRPRLKRNGKIRLGWRVRVCPHCSKKTKVNLDTCEHCARKVPPAAPQEMNPVAAEHFVLDDVPELIDIYGPTPTQLNIFFPFNDVPGNLIAAHKLYSGWGKLCEGDGESITHAIDRTSGKTTIRNGRVLLPFSEKDPEGRIIHHQAGDYAPCPGIRHNLYSKCAGCKPNTTIKVMIRETPRFATYDLVTRSIHNYQNVMGQLMYFMAPVEEGGYGAPQLRGIPFILSIGPEQIQMSNLDKNDKPKPNEPPKKWVTKWLLSLEIDLEYMEAMVKAQRQLASPDRLLGLPAPPPPAPAFDPGPAPEADFNQEEVIIESVATVVRLSDLTKLEFFGKVKKDLGIPADIAGWLALRAGLVNGTYDPGRADQIWDLLSGCQPLVAFVRRTMEQVPGFAKASQVLEAIDDHLMATDLEGGALAFTDDLAVELLAELNKVGSRLADEAVAG